LLDLRGLLLHLLGRPGVVTFVVPLVTVVLSLGFSLGATKRSWKPEDFAVGFDVTMVALGSDLGALAGWRMLDPHDVYVRAHLELAIIAVPVLLWTCIGMVIWVRCRGWEDESELNLLKGVFYPLLWGLAAVAAVYWVIARLLGAP
jgi:hypothetical protein